MRHSACRLLAVSSLLLVQAALGANRPQYGGTLHVAMRSAPVSIDPAERTQPDSVGRRNLLRLLFDTLVTMDDSGRAQPALALSWESYSGGQRWQFWLRRDVQFDDGTQLAATTVAASLRVAHPDWNISGSNDSVVIELSGADPSLVFKLALPANAIARRATDKVTGTGPFRVSIWQPGKRLVVVANEEYWGGRPYLDAIEIDLGKTSRDQMVALELGKADVTEVPAEQARRIQAEGRRVSISAPVELVALVFTREAQSAEEAALREAVSLSVDRAAVRSVLLQGEGELAGGLLPNWMTGYEFLFPDEANIQKARQKRSEARQAPSWTLGYDASDPLDRLIAERVALNARDAGIVLQLTSTGSPDVRLLRVPLASISPGVALVNLATTFGLQLPRAFPDSTESLFQYESSLLQTRRIIPLLHLPVNYGLSPSAKSWSLRRDGGWEVRDIWMGAGKP
jgi:peptide/nickel transport system substrate-binding protein